MRSLLLLLITAVLLNFLAASWECQANLFASNSLTNLNDDVSDYIFVSDNKSSGGSDDAETEDDFTGGAEYDKNKQHVDTPVGDGFALIVLLFAIYSSITIIRFFKRNSEASSSKFPAKIQH